MKVVALISGGKDSCYNMLQCIAAGHEIVALANLHPRKADEIDSHMYQSIGHKVLSIYAEALNLPLYRQIIHGKAINQDMVYTETEGDEVEDLYLMLKKIKLETAFQGVSVGAILSNYQRYRVENVCSRLGLTPLAFLWRRDQSKLLEEMIECDIEAVIVKIASMGLTVEEHLGNNLKTALPKLQFLRDRFDISICGEGGEYESFTLNCPIFRKRIIIDEAEKVILSDNPFAPVAILKIKKIHLEDKHNLKLNHKELLLGLTVKNPVTFVSNDLAVMDTSDPVPVEHIDKHILTFDSSESDVIPPSTATIVKTHTGWVWITNLQGRSSQSMSQETEQESEALEGFMHSFSQASASKNPQYYKSETTGVEKKILDIEKEFELQAAVDAAASLFGSLEEQLVAIDLSPSDVVCVHLYVKNLSTVPQINEQFRKMFHPQYPVRTTVQVALPDNVVFLMDVLLTSKVVSSKLKSYSPPWETISVLSISHWVPPAIGPYSLIIKVGELLFTSGVMPLIPGNLKLVPGGLKNQLRLCMRHIHRLLVVINPDAGPPNIVQMVAYVTSLQDIKHIRAEWYSNICSNALLSIVVVADLPKGARILLDCLSTAKVLCHQAEEFKAHFLDRLKVKIEKLWSDTERIFCVNLSAGPVSIEDLISKRGNKTQEVIDESVEATLKKTKISGRKEKRTVRTEDLKLLVDMVLRTMKKLNHDNQDLPIFIRIFYKINVYTYQQIKEYMDKICSPGLSYSLVPVFLMENESFLIFNVTAF